MAKRKFDRELQFGILPWRIGEGGTREVLLLHPARRDGGLYRRGGR
jgi:hypothetical protein